VKNLDSIVVRNYEKEFESLMSKIISSLRDINGDDEYQSKKKAILDIYYHRFQEEIKNGTLPDIADIVTDVIEYNYDVLNELAALDMSYGSWCPRYSHIDELCFFLSPPEGDTLEDIDVYEAYFNAWFEEYSIEFRDGLPELIMQILQEERMCFITEDHRERYQGYLDDLPRDEFYIYKNDAQNLLLKDWHIAIITGKYQKNYFYLQEDFDDILNSRFYLKIGEG
jgi:hypothetical protein